MDGIQFVAKLTITKDTLQIELGFWERLGSFSRNTTIQRSDITEVGHMEKVSMSIFGDRVIGTALPKVVLLGRFRKSKSE